MKSRGHCQESPPKIWGAGEEVRFNYTVQRAGANPQLKLVDYHCVRSCQDDTEAAFARGSASAIVMLPFTPTWSLNTSVCSRPRPSAWANMRNTRPATWLQAGLDHLGSSLGPCEIGDSGLLELREVRLDRPRHSALAANPIGARGIGDREGQHSAWVHACEFHDVFSIERGLTSFRFSH